MPLLAPRQQRRSLNGDVARHLHSLFPNSELFLLPEARHFPQLDEPEEVARLILSAPRAEQSGLALSDDRTQPGTRLHITRTSSPASLEENVTAANLQL